MYLKKGYKRRCPYNKKRYWYHVSTTLKKKVEHLIPWDEVNGFNRGGNEPRGERICVAPSIEQCITAIPYHLGVNFIIYRTKDRIKANKPVDVFDSKVTQEGWIHHPTSFVKIGILKFGDVEKGLSIDDVIEQSASGDNSKDAKKVLKWWRKAKIRRFVKRA